MKIPSVGANFGRWIVVSSSWREEDGFNYVNCRCSCGTVRRVRINNLHHGSTSCGCTHIQHGMAKKKTREPEYAIWGSMIQRCENPKNRAYKNYGGRGIAVCPEWRSFERFISDMGRRPTPSHTLEREDNSKGYGSDNCIWATRKKQQNNIRTNHVIEYRGEKHTLSEWSDILGFPEGKILGRLRLGWSAQRALSTP